MSGHVSPKSHYFAIFAALLVLTLITVKVAYLDLGPLNNVAALAIASLKGLLVVLFFMHVKYNSRLTWVFAGAGFFWLIFLFGITMADYVSRDWLDLQASIYLPQP
jgi:cytochrome c oxidase subunit IV